MTNYIIFNNVYRSRTMGIEPKDENNGMKKKTKKNSVYDSPHVEASLRATSRPWNIRRDPWGWILPGYSNRIRGFPWGL